MRNTFVGSKEKQIRRQLVIKAMALASAICLMAHMPAEAQSLKETGISVFNALYAVVGVCGAIAVVITGINWAWGNFLGHGDAKKIFFQALIGTGIALAAVAIVQFLKGAVGSSSSGIGGL